MALSIKNGNLFLCYCFDIAYEIKLDEVKKIFGRKPESAQLVYERLTPEYVRYKVPPLLARLGKREIKTSSFSLNASAKVKLYGFGVATIIYQIPIKGDLKELARLTSELAENKLVADIAKKEIMKLVSELKGVIDTLQEELDYWEDYLIVSVKEFNEKVSAQDLLRGVQAQQSLAKFF